jgi:hypothetical protein
LVSVWWGTDIVIIDLQQGIHNKHVQLHLFQWQLLQSTSVRNIFCCYARTEWQLKKPHIVTVLIKMKPPVTVNSAQVQPSMNSAAWPTNPSLGISLLRQAITDQPDLHDKTSSLFGYATLITADLLKSTCTINSCPYSIHMKYFYVEMEETDLVCTLRALLK